MFFSFSWEINSISKDNIMFSAFVVAEIRLCSKICFPFFVAEYITGKVVTWCCSGGTELLKRKPRSGPKSMRPPLYDSVI